MDSSQITASRSSLVSASSTIASALAPKGALTAKANAAATTGSSGTGTTSTANTTDPSTITSSDFLTLLVSELKNQDPTQPTDPNAYITQLVGVNSLQQLISINQGITSLAPTATTASAIGSPSPTPGSTSAPTGG
jgi:flagellar basal-body rod modification protein FlgD